MNLFLVKKSCTFFNVSIRDMAFYSISEFLFWYQNKWATMKCNECYEKQKTKELAKRKKLKTSKTLMHVLTMISHTLS